MRFFSLEGKLAGAVGATLIVAALTAASLTRWIGSAQYGALAAIAILLIPALLFGRKLAQPVASVIRALSGSVTAFRDGDFSFSIANRRRDEVGDLVDAHNELGRVLREQRQNLFQRELLLDTVVQNTPTALVLIEPGGHVVYSNVASRALLNGGRSLNGELFADLMTSAPEPLAQALLAEEDRLFTVPLEQNDETYHLSQRNFQLHGRRHRMLMIRRMTRELSRQEVITWKKVLRVISHEINNSLAPIRSLSHSARELARRGDIARLGLVFETIEDRARHLEGFIHGYARFAKLPLPQPAQVEWQPLLDALAQQYPFRLVDSAPSVAGWFDRTQIEQALINLLKNAHESGSDPGAIEVNVARVGRELRIEVRDGGPGMSETVLTNALLPFYSTKRSGSGLGLALTREITEAHAGRVQLANRIGAGLTVTLILPQPEGGR
ncbi:MAG: ATP-binding protein [Dokdonella sp.]